jgi:PilZ domain
MEVSMADLTHLAFVRDHEGRRYKRIRINLPGQLFNPDTNATFPCTVLNLSPSGAGVECAANLQSGETVILYLEAFGRFEGAIVLHGNADTSTAKTLGITFSHNETKELRVADLLSAFLSDGIDSVARLRRTTRVRTNGLVVLTLTNGQHVNCELIDISTEGVALKTTVRPPIGAVVAMGNTRGEVVRYHESGIALHFVR